MTKLWRVNCQEKEFPGMWQRWYKNQCVAVGWSAYRGFKLDEKSKNKGWNVARKALKAMERGDYIIVSLRGHRVGRLGRITNKLIGDDEWNPLVPASKSYAHGEMGRRIEVRWDLTTGPGNQDLVVQLPVNTRFSTVRKTISEIHSTSIEVLKSTMNDSANWVSLLGNFSYEKALSNYIANYPNHLEDGFLPHPDKKVREKLFKDRTRADVLLVDKENKTVIVECKQHSPTITDITQLRHYMKLFFEEEGEKPRGILVHGGAQKLASEVIAYAGKEPSVEIINYVLDVQFRSSK